MKTTPTHCQPSYKKIIEKVQSNGAGIEVLHGLSLLMTQKVNITHTAVTEIDYDNWSSDTTL